VWDVLSEERKEEQFSNGIGNTVVKGMERVNAMVGRYAFVCIVVVLVSTA
jgi:hypothetical protein